MLAAAQAQDQVEGALLLDVVVGQDAAVLELLARKDEPLLVRGDALLVLDLGLDVVDRVAGLDLKRDGFADESAYKDLHRGGSLVCLVKPTGWGELLWVFAKNQGPVAFPGSININFRVAQKLT